LPSAHVMREKYKNKFQNVDIGCEKCWKWYVFSKMLTWM
jgi:hypothetical protein